MILFDVKKLVLLTAIIVKSCATSKIMFMQGNSHALGSSKLWSLDTDTKHATELAAGHIPDKYMFTSHGAICSGVYHTVSWFLPDVSNPFSRRYSLSSFDLSGNDTFSNSPLPDNYYGVWCSPKDASSLYMIMSHKTNNSDPLRANKFYVQSLDTTTKEAETLAGPVTAPKNEYIPIADGVFSFDGVDKFWLSFSVDSDERKGLFHADRGVTHVLDLSSSDGSHAQYDTGLEEGYLVMTKAATNKTWGVLKKLSRKDTKLSLSFVDLQLSGGKIVTSKLSDALLTANSMGLPGAVCGDTLYTFNTDDYDGPFQMWYNLSALDIHTGLSLWQMDTLHALPGSQFAFVTGFACDPRHPWPRSSVIIDD